MHVELHPAMEEAIARRDEERGNQLERRERAAELSLAVGTLIGGIAPPLLAPGPRGFDPAPAPPLWAALPPADPGPLPHRPRPPGPPPPRPGPMPLAAT